MKKLEQGLVEIGYTKVNKNLMHKIGNKPYIDVESVIASLIPNDLNKNLRYKLMKLKRFLDNLVNHDKFEFQIMPGTIILDKNLSESIKMYSQSPNSNL